jgi:hypothetical protein
MGHPVEARTQRLRRHLRRPHAGRGDPVMINAGYTLRRTGPHLCAHDLRKSGLSAVVRSETANYHRNKGVRIPTLNDPRRHSTHQGAGLNVARHDRMRGHD